MSDGTTRGRISVHPRGFGFLVVEAPTPISAFIAPPDLNPFLDGDVVTARLTSEGNGRFVATELALVSRARAEVFGSVVLRGGKRYLRIDRSVANTDWPLDTTNELAEGTHVVAEVSGDRLVVARVVPEGADLGVERCIARHGLRAVFAETLDRTAEEAATRPIPMERRRDLRSVPTVTIDAASTRDIDDALSAYPADASGALRVLVSIADVDVFVPERSILDREARLRGTSVYLAGRVLPMLPEAISSRAASLVEGEDRPALTAELRIDPEGRITSVDVYESLVRSRARLTYDAVDTFLSESHAEGVPPAVESTLRWLRTAVARLSAVRAARGGVNLAREEAKIELDAGTGEPIAIEARRETPAHRLVERLMVAANEAVAEWLVARGLPGIYRVHDEPSPERVRTLAQLAHNFGIEAGFGPRLSARSLAAFETQIAGARFEPAIRTVLGQTLGPARYTPDPGPHFGLGAPLYLHFTSPIRRYADLVVHRILKRYLEGHRDYEDIRAGLAVLAADCDRSSQNAGKAEAERHRMLVARLYASRLGEQVSGNIIAIKPFGLLVQIAGTGAMGSIAMEALPGGPFRTDLAAQALIGHGQRFAVGDRIQATVAAVHEELGRIDLVPVG
ncbi:ribonuclease R family protein [Polyangium jinanense]|uniref:exoribonuclease II n=1 Tax=Polyangium jinanense TaxID=2829994 RepID=A0A9X3XA87_9BACT|nr:VacB/RNase II family 3'-5' exoribonuclease [Polyangium jinanense]MDC3956469.1 VacB/RNase II family 3'-5' exoribonuclease [Polyangium jinanense]MDC3985500.1 VacB/RNase II family 3'-5' exoribonuclease [Polyangium jinanense]